MRSSLRKDRQRLLRCDWVTRSMYAGLLRQYRLELSLNGTVPNIRIAQGCAIRRALAAGARYQLDDGAFVPPHGRNAAGWGDLASLGTWFRHYAFDTWLGRGKNIRISPFGRRYADRCHFFTAQSAKEAAGVMSRAWRSSCGLPSW